MIKVKCSKCGKEMEVDVAYEEGAPIDCPSCGEKVVYDKPVRIELPVRPRRPVEENAGSVSPAAGEDSERREISGGIPALEPKRKKLGLKRDGDDAKVEVDLNAEALKRRMAEEEREKAEEEARFAAAMRNRRKQQLLHSLFVTGIVVVAVAIVAVIAVKIIAVRKEAARRRYELEVREMEIQRLKDEAESEKRAAERKAREEREAEEREARRNAERMKREADEIARKERERNAEAERLAAEARAKAQAEERAKREEGKRIYHDETAAFAKCRLMPWSTLAKNLNPGKGEWTGYCIVPHERGDERFFEIVSHLGGGFECRELNGRDTPIEMTSKDFDALTRERGAVLRIGTAAYLLAPVEKSESQVKDERYFKPVDAMMPGLDRLIGRHSLNTDALRLEVSFIGSRKNDPSGEVDTLRFDETISREKILKMIENYLKVKLAKRKRGAPRRTVAFYDGKFIKRDMHGVTYIPRSSSSYSAEYSRLASEARKQEELERRDKVEREREYDELVKEEARAAYEVGKISVKVKVKK